MDSRAEYPILPQPLESDNLGAVPGFRSGRRTDLPREGGGKSGLERIRKRRLGPCYGVVARLHVLVTGGTVILRKLAVAKEQDGFPFTATITKPSGKEYFDLK